ncbi:MAG: hypothetical protein ACOCYE_04390 [Pseudomonadota bacterium]
MTTSAELHPMAPAHLPAFVGGPDGSDPLFGFVVAFVLVAVLLLGNFYLKLHSLPDMMAHRANSTQYQVIGILTLLALFTHNNLFWVAALLLAALKLPDFATPLYSIARSLERWRGRGTPQPTTSTSTSAGNADA